MISYSLFNRCSYRDGILRRTAASNNKLSSKLVLEWVLVQSQHREEIAKDTHAGLPSLHGSNNRLAPEAIDPYRLAKFNGMGPADAQNGQWWTHRYPAISSINISSTGDMKTNTLALRPSLLPPIVP